MMTRRHWLQLSTAGLSATAHLRAQSAGTSLKAGPFTVTPPEEWAKSAVITEVPLRPLYSKDSWAAYQKDSSYSLKPGYDVRPHHWSIVLPALVLPGSEFDPKTAGDNETAPQILIHKADEWNVAFTDGTYQDKPAADVVQSLRKDLEALQTQDLPQASPGYMDATLSFQCLKKPLKFEGGSGIRMLCQWTIEPTLLEHGALHYLFLGMSADNTCQIIATVPISLPGLPNGGPTASHLGRSIKRYEELSKGIALYEQEAKQWLEQRASTITPDLNKLDAMMQSLSVTTWK